MKLTVSSGNRQVHIAIKGSSAKQLRRVEQTAARLLAAGPEPTPPKPVGFSFVADTELAAQDG